MNEHNRGDARRWFVHPVFLAPATSRAGRHSTTILVFRYACIHLSRAELYLAGKHADIESLRTWMIKRNKQKLKIVHRDKIHSFCAFRRVGWMKW